MILPAKYRLPSTRCEERYGKKFRHVLVRRQLEGGYYRPFSGFVDSGFSLLEVTITLLLGAVFLSSSLFVYLSLWDGYAKVNRRVQTLVMEVSLRRLFVQDVHAASKVKIQPHSVSLRVNNETYDYYVNGEGQCVRVRAGGGTTVLASGVETISAGMTGTVMRIELRFKDGQREIIRGSTLSSIEALAKKNIS